MWRAFYKVDFELEFSWHLSLSGIRLGGSRSILNIISHRVWWVVFSFHFNKREKKKARISDPHKMYTVNKGSSKLVAKTRGGLSTFKSIDVISSSHDTIGAADRLNPQRPVFHNTRKNHHHHHNHHSSTREPEEIPLASPQHEELVKFIQDSWTELAIPNEEQSPASESTNGHQESIKSSAKRIVIYSETPSEALKDFGAFDLESWWGRRLFNNITNGR